MSSRAYALSRSFPTVLHISDDQGTTWSDITPTGLPTDPSDIKDINVGYYNAYRVLVCGYNGVGVRISNDAGASFTTVPNSTVFNFDKVLVQDSNLLWAFGDTILFSADGGVTWTNTGVSPVTLYGAPGAKVTAVYTEDNEPNGVYIAINEKLFLSAAGGQTWRNLNSDTIVPLGDIITSIHTNTGSVTIACSSGVYNGQDTLVPPYYAWTNTLSLPYSPPYKNEMVGGTGGGGGPMALIDPYGNIYESAANSAIWNPVPINSITFSGTPPLNQRMVRYTSSRFIIYTDSPGKLYEATSNGSTTSLIDTYPGAVIGLTRSINVACLECPQKWELDENDPTSNTCVPVDAQDIFVCPVGYVYNSTNNICESTFDSSTVPTVLPYSTTLCSEIDPLASDGRGLFSCLYTYNINPCGYELTPCTGSSEPILTDTDLSDYLTSIISIQGSELCYTITQLPEGIYSNYADVIVDEVFTDCSECQPKYPLYNCNDVSVVLYTQEDLAQYVGQTITIEDYPNECWQVGPSALYTDELVTPVIVTNSYATCLECNPIKYQLVNCLNNESFIVSDSELANYLGKVIRVDGIPGICFTVKTDLCDCLKIETRLNTFTANKVSELNGKNAYQFVDAVSGDLITLYWDSAVMQWKFVDETGTVLSYSPIDTPCPTMSYWITEITSPIQNMVVTGCYNVIYDITVENSFPNCEYCVNC